MSAPNAASTVSSVSDGLVPRAVRATAQAFRHLGVERFEQGGEGGGHRPHSITEGLFGVIEVLGRHGEHGRGAVARPIVETVGEGEPRWGLCP